MAYAYCFGHAVTEAQGQTTFHKITAQSVISGFWHHSTFVEIIKHAISAITTIELRTDASKVSGFSLLIGLTRHRSIPFFNPNESSFRRYALCYDLDVFNNPRERSICIFDGLKPGTLELFLQVEWFCEHGGCGSNCTSLSFRTSTVVAAECELTS